MNERGKKPAGAGLPAGEWLNVFRTANVETERLDAAKSTQARVTIVGNFLARMVGREVPIEVDGRTGKATLRTAAGRGNKKLYWFDVIFADDSPGDDKGPPLPSVNGAPRKQFGKVPTAVPVETRDNPLDRSPALGWVPGGNDEAW